MSKIKNLLKYIGMKQERLINRQKEIIKKFDEDFTFKLTDEEVDELSRSQNVTLNKETSRESNINTLLCKGIR